MVLKGFAIPKEAWDDTLHVETRLDRIEELMAQLAESQAEAWHSQALANRSIDRLSMRVDQLTVRVDKVSQDGEVRDFLKVFRTFLPEYREKKIIGTMASLYVESSVLSFGQKNGLVLLGLVGEIMQVLNDAVFRPHFFELNYGI